MLMALSFLELKCLLSQYLIMIWLDLSLVRHGVVIFRAQSDNHSLLSVICNEIYYLNYKTLEVMRRVRYKQNNNRAVSQGVIVQMGGPKHHLSFAIVLRGKQIEIKKS